MPTQTITLPHRELVDLYAAGCSINELAKRYHVGYTTMHDRLKQLGVRLRPQGPALGSNRLSHSAFEITADLYRSGLTQSQIGRQLGISRHSVRHRLRRAGIERQARCPT